MRPKNQAARDQLTSELTRQGPISATGMAERLNISVATLHRLLQEIEGSIISRGKARRTRYALRKPLRGELAELPLYAIGPSGQAELLSHLALMHPFGACMSLANTPWPVPEESQDGWWDGLPYPLYDMRPQGYMGRQLAHARHQEWGVSANPDEWTDVDLLYVLSQSGSDLSGNLILGNPAYEAWQRTKLSPPEPLKPSAISLAYVRLAEQAVSSGAVGSSTAGEFPKFTALRELPDSATPHVLVKFSGADESPAVRRWADLLICEHLALTCAATLPGLQSAASRIVTHLGRTFLEVERFDRHGLCSLATIDAAFIGDGTSNWPLQAQRLAN